MKKKLILLISIIVVITTIIILNNKIELELKDNKTIKVEYGNDCKLTFEDLINIKDLPQNKLSTIKKETKITNNFKKEIGEYEVIITYKKQTLKKKIKVTDTTPPTFNETNEITIQEGTKDYDFNTKIKATDLTNVNITYDTSTLDINKPGNYIIKAIAIDTSNNQTTKDIKVIIKAKPAAPTATVYQGGGKVICIDAGHQARGNSSLEPNGPGSSIKKAKVTTGATGCVTGKTESSINLEVALKLQQALTKQGYTVIMCRTSQNVDISNAQRAEIANNYNAAAFIRLHCDSSESSSASGTLTLAPSTNNPYCASIAGKSQNLSRLVVNEICNMTGSRNRGVTITDTMTGLNWSKVPVTIVEMGFLSNPNEDRLLASSAYQDKIVQGIVNGIGKFLGA